MWNFGKILKTFWLKCIFRAGVLAQTALTKCYRPGSLNKRHLFLSSGSWEVQDQGAGKFGSQGELLTVLQKITALLCVHMAFLSVFLFL